METATDFQQTIKAIHDDIPSNPLRAFDTALITISGTSGKSNEKEESRLLKSAARAILQSIDFEGALNADQPIEHLFSPSISTQKKKRIGVCLLRLLVAYPNVMRHADLSHRLVNLFDDVFDENLYRLAKIDRTDQTFKKFEELRTLVFTVESEISAAVEALAHLDGINTFRSNYFKRVNSGGGTRYRTPFFPRKYPGRASQCCT